MDELDLIRRIAKLTRARSRDLVLGIGDDCAIFHPPGAREDLLFTTDLMLEGIHFIPQTHGPDVLGWKTLARGLSDIAAMGGEPRFCLVSLAAGAWITEAWIEAFYRGMLKLARATGAVIAGGDLARAERMACDIVVCGAAPKGAALRRDGARPGDRIYVSGRLGGAALGLETGRGAEWKKHATPEPRLALGRFLRGRATACIDLSDGLSLDLHRLCAASGAAAELDQSAIPVFRGATLEMALHGGEDYELLFTAPARAALPASHARLPLTPIGEIVRGKAGRVRLDGRPLPPAGYDHFSSARA